MIYDLVVENEGALGKTLISHGASGLCMLWSKLRTDIKSRARRTCICVGDQSRDRYFKITSVQRTFTAGRKAEGTKVVCRIAK